MADMLSFRAAFGVTGRRKRRWLGVEEVGSVGGESCPSDRQERGEGREGAFDVSTASIAASVTSGA